MTYNCGCDENKNCEQWFQAVVVMRYKLWTVTYNGSCGEKQTCEQWFQTVVVMR